MAVIDDKVVAMSFENKKFESGVSQTMSSIEKLKSSLNFKGAGKGFGEIDAASRKLNFSHIGTSLDDIKNRLGAFRLAAIGMLAQVGMKAVSTGLQMANAFTIGPIKAGLQEYTTNLNAVQTILANTQASGAKLKDVNAALLELNKYSDKTIYNFSQMARNIGTFTAAGVDLKTSTAAIKGIANLAAVSGSSAEQASTAMYQLSQAISAGRVGLQDWNSVVNAGMGGTVFQRALAQTAVAMGVLNKDAVKLVGPMKNVSVHGQSFRQSMMAKPGEVSWLTSDVLVKTLKQFTGDMSVAELKAQGFNDAQIKAIRAQAQVAMEAATKVKTLGQVLDVAKETAQSGWAQTWQIIFGDFGEARTLFTGLSNAVNGFINASANARNKVLGDWKELGGRTVLIEAIKTAFEGLGAILKPIKEAFRDIFPAQTGKSLYDLTVRFKEFAETIKPSPETVENLHRTFRGLFAILDIGKQIVSGIFTVFGQLFHAVGGGSGGFLKFTANIGDFLVALDKALKKGDAFHLFFVKIGAILTVPVKLLQALAEAIANLFSGFSPGEFSDKMSSLSVSAKPFQKIIESIANALQELGPAIGRAMGNINWDTVLAVVRTGLFGALVLMLKKFIGGATLEQIFGVMGKNIGKSFGGGLFKNITKPFGQLTGTMKAMQDQLKAQTLKEIAIAIALLAASVLALSLVDPKRLNSSMSALVILFGELMGAMVVMNKFIKIGGAAKLGVISGALILLAVAIDLLTIAVFALSRLSWEELAKGLGGIAILLGSLSAASLVLSKNSAGMVRAGAGITAIAIGLNVMAIAVGKFGAMNLSTLAKGLGSVAVALGIMTVAGRAMPKGMALQGAGLIVVAEGLNLLAGAVNKFGSMNLRTLGTGLAGIGSALVVIAGSVRLMPKSMALQAAGLLLVAASLGKIADAVGEMGAMSIEQLAKGLISLGGALVILAAGMKAMAGSMTGAIALTAAAAGIALLAPALIKLGSQSWTEIIKSMVALGAAIGILAAAALLLSPSIPALLGFGAALVLIGGGLALAGTGIALIGAGLSAIAVSGPVAIAILVSALIKFSEAIPTVVSNFVKGLVQMVTEIGEAMPKIVEAMDKILSGILDLIIRNAPKMAQAFTTLVLAALQALVAKGPQIIQAGLTLLLQLLQGIQNNIGKITTQVATIIVTFLNALASNLGKIVAAGANVLVKLLEGIADSLGKIVTSVANIITKFISSLSANWSKIITAGADLIVQLVSGIAKNLAKIVTAAGDAVVSFITGIGKKTNDIITAGVDVIISFIQGLTKNAVRLANAAGEAIVQFLRGLRIAVETYAPQIRTESAKLGIAIVDGMTGGLLSKAESLYDTARGIAGKVGGILGKVLSIRSPSRLTFEMGKFVVQGLALGMQNNTPIANAAAAALGNGTVRSLSNAVRGVGGTPAVMQELGKFVGGEFAKGIVSSKEDSIKAFNDLNALLLENMKTARKTIIEETAKLEELRKAKDVDLEAIKKAQTALNESQILFANSSAAHTALTTTLKKEKNELIGLAGQYETVGTKLKAAQDVLAKAIETRNQAQAGYTSQYSKLPALVFTDADGNPIDPTTVVTTYLQDLGGQITAVEAYNSTLEQLRNLGLDDATYQKLLEEGTADQSFATQLLAGGKTAVDGLNKLDKQLQKVSKELGTNAADNLYQAGILAARGIVNGLHSQQDEIRREMESIARSMVAALKRELHVKSPSRVFMEIGQYVMQGLARGIESEASQVVDKLRKTMNDITSLITEGIDSNPVIVPILDLSQVQKDAKNLASIVSATPITAQASLAQASVISLERSQVQQETAETAAPSGPQIKFEQNNYSPEALSEVEIYRQTKNQLSQLKTAFAH